MVSKAREDLPEPDSPVITTSLSRGISRSMFLRLCWRQPFKTIFSINYPITRFGAEIKLYPFGGGGVKSFMPPALLPGLQHAQAFPTRSGVMWADERGAGHFSEMDR